MIGERVRRGTRVGSIGGMRALVLVALAGCSEDTEALDGGGGGGRGDGATMHPALCPGAMPQPEGASTCRTSEDCPFPSYTCGNDLAVYTCGGACQQGNRVCEDDTQCPNGVCESFQEPCLCSPSTRCVPRCIACAAGERCDMDGRCRPIRCDDGFACDAGTVCDPASGFADPHGCRPTTCTEGFACPEGTRCEPGFYAVRGCSPIPCTEGFECPANMDCDGGPSPHGCTIRSCTIDTDCDCGACVNTRCGPRIGVCSSPPPP